MCKEPQCLHATEERLSVSLKGMRRINAFKIFLILVVTSIAYYTLLPSRTPQETEQLLTHLIVPLHVKQKHRMKAFFDSWRQYPPCTSQKNRLHFNPPLAHQVTVILQVSSETEITALDRYDLLKYAPKQFKCIKEVKIREMVLNQDSYLVGSRLMLEGMLTNQMGLVNPKYIFQMEPDCHPLKPGWLQAVDAAVRWPNAPFWMKGSHFRGHSTPNLAGHIIVRSHINGNAIFNLRDPQFVHFYFNTVKPFINKHYIMKGSAYDLDFYRMFFNSTASYFPQFQHHLHKFQYSEVIQNHWHSRFNRSELLSTSPNTFIVHGGNED